MLAYVCHCLHNVIKYVQYYILDESYISVVWLALVSCLLTCSIS